MTNPDSDEELGKAMRRYLNADYLNKYIKEQFKKAMSPLLKGEMVFFAECSDLILLFIFTHIDLLGGLFKGKTSSANAVEFMREYLGRIDKRYKNVSGLIYDGLRHGLVHLATPKRIQFQNGVILDFQFIFAKKQQRHLIVTKRDEHEITGSIEIYRLGINVYQLYEDLIYAMEGYAEDVRLNQILSEIFGEAFETRRKPEKATEKQLLNKAYIQQSDFEFVREQVSKL